ncbi:tetratricopeptide repeat protein [Saccharothrix saharensis]|uniref:tetratricopeptide repeat protein n=1 Tax=Saccharothrix saharensis TaxID=571190 RepID=UPI003691CA33
MSATNNENHLDGHASGPVVQAGLVHGGVHIHHGPEGTDRPQVTPRQLPAEFPHFVGRASELDQLTEVLDNSAEDGATLVISAISGTAGVGKTTLAVHWAHRAAERFPDGQLYVNLRGFDPTGVPVPPAEALRGFLDAFQVPPERIPTDFGALQGLYRTTLAGRRVLLILDNARSSEQVRPLLPGQGTCLTLITSRDQLTGLVARNGARPMTLKVLKDDEAVELLRRRLGAPRVAAEPDAVSDLIRLCARLPLALALVAARAETQEDLELATLAEELRDERRRFDALDAGDSDDSARAVFSWSYRALTPDAARLFRLLGLHPGSTVSAAAAAALAGVRASDVRAPMAELVRAHLVERLGSGRYQCHDLLRSYAAELAAAEEPDARRRAAVRRLLDFSVQTFAAADRRIAPQRERIALQPPTEDVEPLDIVDEQRALDWFVAERAAVPGVIDLAVHHGFDIHVWQLAWTVATYLERQGHWQDWVATQEAALSAAKRLDDRAAQARTRRLLSRAAIRLGRHDDAATHLQHALDLYQDLGRELGQARTHIVFSWVRELQQRYGEAVEHAARALDLFRAAGNRAGEARALDQLGWEQALLGEHAQALTNCQDALVLFRELDHRPGLADTLDSLGYIHHHLGDHTAAIGHYEQSITLSGQLGDYYTEATTWSRMGDTYVVLDRRSTAAQMWRRALTLLDRLVHPDADEVRAKLAALVGPEPRPGGPRRPRSGQGGLRLG